MSFSKYSSSRRRVVSQLTVCLTVRLTFWRFTAYSRIRAWRVGKGAEHITRALARGPSQKRAFFLAISQARVQPVPAGGALCSAGGRSAGGSRKIGEPVRDAPVGDTQDGSAQACRGAQVDELFDPAKTRVSVAADDGRGLFVKK